MAAVAVPAAWSRRCTPALRRKLLMPVVAFAVVATPQVVRSSLARGQLTFTTRAVWHVALVGLGYYPNPYGLELKDEVVFKLTKDRSTASSSARGLLPARPGGEEGVPLDLAEGSGLRHPVVLRTVEGSVAGSTETSVLSFLSVSNLTYRIACLIGFVAMMLRGGDKRLLGIAAAGMYAIYVVLTCVFYFVGLAYDNVSEVTLLVLFMGGLEAVLYVAPRLAGTDWLDRAGWPSTAGRRRSDPALMTQTQAARSDRRLQRREEHRRGPRARARSAGGGVPRRGAGARRLVEGPDVREEPGRACVTAPSRSRCTCCSTR